MLKKLTSLFLSLLLCLSLLPDQARAAGAPEPAAPPVAVEPSGPETQEEPPVMPLASLGGDIVEGLDDVPES